MQSFLKKLIPLVFLGSIAFNSYGMEELENGDKKPNQSAGQSTINNRAAGVESEDEGSSSESEQSTINDCAYEANPIYAMGDLKKLAKENGWIIERSMSDDHAERIFNLFPNDMQALLREFANEESRTISSYRHAIFLDGPPGVGKSTAGFVIAKYFNIAHIFIRAPSIATEFKDSANQNLIHLIDTAKKEKLPVIITIDEISALLDRHKSEHNSDHGIIENFFQAIDSLDHSNVFVILTTNGMDNYPDNFVSRFRESIFKIPKPSPEAKKLIIESLMNSYEISDEKNKAAWESFIAKLSDSLDDFREIEDLFEDAFRNAQSVYDHTKHKRTQLFEIHEKDFLNAQTQVIQKRPSVLLKQFKKASKFCKDHAMVISISLAVITGIGTYYYFNKQHNFSLQSAAAQLKKQDDLKAIAAWEQIHVPKPNFLHVIIKFLPVIGRYLEELNDSKYRNERNQAIQALFTRGMDAIPTAKIGEVLTTLVQEIHFSPQEKATLAGVTIGEVAGTIKFIATMVSGMKAGALKGAAIDMKLAGQSLGIGTVTGTIVGGLCGIAYYLWLKK